MLRELGESLGLLQAFAQGLLGDQLAVVVAEVALFAQGIEHAHGGGADAQGVHQAADGGLVVAGLAGGGAPTLGVQSGISHGAIETMRVLRPNQTLELVHRLDRDTSGLLVMAKKRSALSELQALLREDHDGHGPGGIRKRYLTLLAGRMPVTTCSASSPCG